MTKLLPLFIFWLLVDDASAQLCPKGFTEQYGYNATGGGTANDFKPSLVIKACIENKPGAAGQQVFWNVKALFHSYKVVRFTKYIKLTCGNTISKQVTLYGLKEGESIAGGSFSGDIYLSDNIFKEDCSNANRIVNVWAGNFTCELVDSDPLVVQQTERQAKIKENKQAGTTVTVGSTPSIRTNASSGTSSSSRTISSSTSSMSSSGSSGVVVTPNSNTAIYNKLNQDIKKNQDDYQAVVGGLQQFGAMLQVNNEKRQATENAARMRREQQQEEDKVKKAENDRIKAERQEEIAEENRTRAAAAKLEMDRQRGIDQQILGNYVVRKKTSEIPDQVKQVFYIVYQRDYQTNRVTIKTYSLKKYSDDSWMLQADLMNKLKFTPYFNSGGIGELLGCFSSKMQAEEAIKQIKNKTTEVRVDSSFLLLNEDSQRSTTDKDFWNN